MRDREQEGGFSLDAKVRIEARDRKGPESQGQGPRNDGPAWRAEDATPSGSMPAGSSAVTA